MKRVNTIVQTLLFVIFISCSEKESETIVINPTPQSIEYSSNKSISLRGGLKVINSANELSDALSFVKGSDKSLPLTVNFGDKLSLERGVKQVDGAYLLTVSDKGVEIIGYNERGAYYGIQTLKQLINGDNLPMVTINDYPDIPYRGVVEGFYGTPWSHKVRKSLIRFYGEHKMTSYLYGPKDDPFHSSPKWREPYPQREAEQIKELVDIAKACRVDFVWAIHPGQDIKWTESDYQKLLAKFEAMYGMGVRSFAIFFDDISGIGTNPVRQAELLNRLHKEFVEVKGDVKPLIMCPTDYTSLWANPSETGYLSILGDTLHPSINIMWTGEAVCCDITDSTLEWVNSRINRPTFIWWNYPVTDYVKHIMLQGPVYGNTQLASDKEMVGFVSNPMEHGEASKLALYSVADYTWNIEHYKPIESWERGIKYLMPEAYEEYRTFAIHSTDTETGYRRDESWETTTFDMDNYTPEQFYALEKEFVKIINASDIIINESKNNLLVSELRPWLKEFKKLGERGIASLALIKLYEHLDLEALWSLFMASIMTPEDIEAYRAHRIGTLKLMPFINNTREAIANKLYSQLSGERLYKPKPMASFANISTEIGKLMLDRDSDTYYHSAYGQGAGSWVAIDMGIATDIKHIYIEQGRNNVDDVDYFDAARLEVSLDGTQWHVVRDNINNEYVINWQGEPIKARYVRLSRLDSSKRSNWLAVRRFEVNPSADNIIFTTNINQLAEREVEVNGNGVKIAPILEVVNVKPNQYFMVELPIISAISDLECDLGDNRLALELSVDGKNWSIGATTAKYIRYVNRADKSVEIRFKKFSFNILSSSGDELAKAIDKDITTRYISSSHCSFAVPDGAKAVTLLSNAYIDSRVSVVINGEESVIDKGLVTIPLPDNVDIIAIKGDIAIYEVIFK